MPKIDSERFYLSAIEMHGDSARGVNWISKKSQELRFDAILTLLPKDLSQSTLVDAGCGFGDFYLYLEKKKRLPKRYIGIDSLSDMCAIASQKTGCEILDIDICKEEIPVADYYVCSGALNVLTPFESVQFIQNCYTSSKVAFIFNALYGEKESETYNYLSQEKIEHIAKDLAVDRLSFKSDYMDGDVTVSFTHQE